MFYIPYVIKESTYGEQDEMGEFGKRQAFRA